MINNQSDNDQQLSMENQNSKGLSISLILATIGREEELRIFLESLLKQTHKEFEVIIVDQNLEDKISSLIFEYSGSLNIKHLKTEIGLSHARNTGLKRTNGDIIAFPDDDCWYQVDLLERVVNLFYDHPEWDGLSGIANSGFGNISRWKWDKAPGKIDRYNVWKRCRSITLFLKKNIIEATGEFDTTLGLGSGTGWNSGEETDYILRALEKGFNIQYFPEIVVNHPDQIPLFDLYEIAKGKKYGCGMGRVMRKHHYPMGFVVLQGILPIGSSIKSLLKGNIPRSRYFFNVCMGRILGWLS